MEAQPIADALTKFAPYFVFAAGVALALMGVYVLVKAHRKNDSTIDLAYLLVDGSLVPPRVTLAKATGFGAFLLSSWVLIYLTASGKLDGTMYAAYLSVWGAVKVAGDFVGSRANA